MSIVEMLSAIALAAAIYHGGRNELRRYRARPLKWRVGDLLYGPFSLDEQTTFKVVEDSGRYIFVEDEDDDLSLYKTGLDDGSLDSVDDAYDWNNYALDEDEDQDEDGDSMTGRWMDTLRRHRRTAGIIYKLMKEDIHSNWDKLRRNQKE